MDKQEAKIEALTLLIMKALYIKDPNTSELQWYSLEEQEQIREEINGLIVSLQRELWAIEQSFNSAKGAGMNKRSIHPKGQDIKLKKRAGPGVVGEAAPENGVLAGTVSALAGGIPQKTFL